ncbi:MLV-related proviral Env polyprotein-like [Mus caroli]|uniref:MLV-related proviral Env polyprotein-like n=1 Tax=Mus caroli TaxID=10089 RepID=A0A6P5P2A3_MUSCR|nr:MLV-related proviral Env polyprotein-like [Mus caroli]
MEQGPPAKSKSPTQMPALPMDPSYTATLTPTAALQNPLTVAPTNPSTGQRMFNLVRGAFYALNRTNPDATEDCWLCLSSGPPYYEGIAFDGDFNKTSSHASCSWGTGQKLTLTEVSARNLGLCIGTPPPTHKHLCGRIQSVSRAETNYYLVPSPVGWWACNSGLTPCVSTKVFKSSHDFCVMIQLLPQVYYHSTSNLEEMYAGTRFKREPVTLTLATFLGIGMAIGVGTGVSALIEGRQGIQSLRDVVNEDLEMLEKSIDALEKSLSSLSEVVLQNRRGLDLLFLKEGGLCADLKEECCFYADHTGIVRDSMQKLRERLERRKQEREAQQGWLESWYSRSPWMTSLFSALAGPVIFICLILIFGPCIIK